MNDEATVWEALEFADTITATDDQTRCIVILREELHHILKELARANILAFARN